jgi:hypothetical protein
MIVNCQSKTSMAAVRGNIMNAMDANDCQSSYQKQFARRWGSPERPNTFRCEQVMIGQQSFQFMLKENLNGRYLQITESADEGFYGVAIPAAGLEDFQQLLAGMVEVADQPMSSFQPEAQADAGADSAQLVLKSSQLQSADSHLSFLLLLTDGSEGRVLQIIKNRGLSHQHLVIPAAGLEAFQQTAQKIIQAASALPPPPPAMLGSERLLSEHILKSVIARIERKSFMLVLKENSRGRYLRITEKSNDFFNCVIVSVSGFAEFKKLLGEMAKAADGPSSLHAGSDQPGLPAGEHSCAFALMQANHKTFVFQLNENPRGRFLRLIEESTTHAPNALIIPASGLNQFNQLVDELIEISDKHPAGGLVFGEAGI